MSTKQPSGGEPLDEAPAEIHARDLAAVRPAQARPAPGLAGMTMRDLANVLVVSAFRNGFLEDLHAGSGSPLTSDPSFSRITDAEMKKLMIEASARLAYLLHLFLEDPDALREQFNFFRPYTGSWEREAVSFDLPPIADLVPKCTGCGASIFSSQWQLCPACGRKI